MRQAVIIIHGIGEQKPMSTLRGFVESIVKYEAWKKQQEDPNAVYEKNYWSKPDDISESYELRRITLAGKGERPTTDFFEYYWAYNMRDTTMAHVWPWFKTLLLKWPWNVPPRLLVIWIISWLLTIGIAISVFTLFQGESPLIEGWMGKAANILISGALVWLQKIVMSYVGDAARYLTPDPANITERHQIRKNGLDLLKRIHEATNEKKQGDEVKVTRKYDRIVLVGHSLGSVIAYDLITYLWPKYNTTYTEDRYVDKKYFDDLEKATSTSKYRGKQEELYTAMKKAGNPWIISDLITMGCPLAHGDFLLAKNKEDFNDRKSDRELPTCPPMIEENQKGYYYFDLDDKRYYLHHAAPFAPAKWTNIYYPGDFIGGSLVDSFGKGIKDIKVTYKGGLRKLISYISPAAHVNYWRDSLEIEKMESYKNFYSIEKLYEALNLNFKEESKEGKPSS